MAKTSSRSARAAATVAIAALVGFATGCAAPVVRSDSRVEPQVPSAPAPRAPIPNYVLPDLKKRIWMTPVQVQTEIPVEFSGVDVAGIVSAKLIEIFNHERSPFVAALAPEDIPSESSEAAKIARGSSQAGLVIPRVTRVEVLRRRAPEGLLKSTTVDVRIEVSAELVDGGSGKTVASSVESELASQTRSELLSTQSLVPEPARQLDVLARRISIKTLGRFLPWAEKLGWSGKVVRLDGARVYIDSGRRTGLKISDTLRVVEAPREIYDPQTGVFVGVAPGRLKATLKIIQLFGQDGAMAAVQSGGGVLPGDRVELF